MPDPSDSTRQSPPDPGQPHTDAAALWSNWNADRGAMSVRCVLYGLKGTWISLIGGLPSRKDTSVYSLAFAMMTGRANMNSRLSNVQVGS